MGRSRLTLLLLLLALHCLSVCSDDPTATTISKPSTDTSSNPAPVALPTATPSLKPPPTLVTTEKPKTTVAPPPPTAAPSNPPTTAAHTATPKATPKATPTAWASVATTQKPSTPSGGGGTTIITTVSKVGHGPTTTEAHSRPLVPTTVMGSAPQTPSPEVPTATPASTAPPKAGGAVTTKETVPAAATGGAVTTKEIVPTATTEKGAAPMDATTKAGGITAVVTPDQSLAPTGPTAPPTVPHTPESTTKPSTAVTSAKPGPGLVPVSPSESRVQTTGPQTTVPPTAAPTSTGAAPAPRIFTYSLNRGHQVEEEKELVSLCQQLMGTLEDGNCTVSFRHHNGKGPFDVEITGKVKATIVTQVYEDVTKKPTDNRTLITILASCGALLIMIIILAVCASHHRKPYSENQLQLTEELQSVENGYHDNPTLEVMEVGGDMQEKKLPLSLNNGGGGGEFNDSWIVPMDNLLKEEGPDEEDTHL